MRFQPALLAISAAALGISAVGWSQENSPAVTDFTMAEVLSIQTNDIIDALAPARGASIDPGAPPTVRLPVYFEFDSDRLQPDARLAAVRRGESVPVAPNGSSTGRQRSRRVELINLGAQP
jgi:outer membrane protein OmpA-like peptidoglycan-associated protein